MQERTGGVAQVIQHLASKHEAFHSNLSTIKDKNKNLINGLHQN
jgi:hypothetical protein